MKKLKKTKQNWIIPKKVKKNARKTKKFLLSSLQTEKMNEIWGGYKSDIWGNSA